MKIPDPRLVHNAPHSSVWHTVRSANVGLDILTGETCAAVGQCFHFAHYPSSEHRRNFAGTTFVMLATIRERGAERFASMFVHVCLTDVGKSLQKVLTSDIVYLVQYLDFSWCIWVNFLILHDLFSVCLQWKRKLSGFYATEKELLICLHFSKMRQKFFSQICFRMMFMSRF